MFWEDMWMPFNLGDLTEDDLKDPLLMWCHDKTAPRLTYAWNWFNYHANQRLTAFNYFLIITALLANGYITCTEKGLYLIQALVGVAGIIISMAFFLLDIRNEQLVDDGRNALWKLESALTMGVGIHRVDYGRPKRWKRLPIGHGFWFRLIEIATLALFLAIAVEGVRNVREYGTQGQFPVTSVDVETTPKTAMGYEGCSLRFSRKKPPTLALLAC
jgi:hypothetical protein